MKQKNHIVLLLHILIWLIIVLIRMALAPSRFTTHDQTIQFTAISMVPYILIFYTTLFVNSYLFTGKKYLLYSVALVAIFFVGIFIFCRSHYFMASLSLIRVPRQLPIFHPIFFQPVILSITAAVAYSIAIAKQTADRQREQLELQKTKMELQFLKSQIHPHFFFNTLNNIYGLSYNNNPLAPKSILMLSQIMRYMVYDAQKERIELAEELAFIQSYINIELLRLPQNCNVQFEYTEINSQLFISPLILLPLVENCFKHSNILDGGEIEIIAWTEESKLYFSCRNTIADSIQNANNGVGMVNLAKQLVLIYPAKYTLDIEIEGNNYFALLTIDLG